MYELIPTTWMTYLCDGMLPNLPIAKSVRHYKKRHWSPTVIRRKSVYEPQEKSRLSRIKDRE
jgi:hypothetical protein